MIPRVARAGRSFKGAALYYLHDKKAHTSERVAFVETVNLPTSNHDLAVAHMIDTATHAAELKQAAGLKSGRNLQTPVYCYSLAWHPSEKPTQAEQLQAAQDTLKLLGLGDRQALIVGHSDTDHPHVHVIVNRVCPTTGKAANMGNDQVKLSQWAQTYEQERGKVFCAERVENNKKRANQWVKDRSPDRRQHMEWKKAQSDQLWRQYREERDKTRASRRGQYDALWRQKENRFAARKDEIKALYRPIWRDVFKRQKTALRNFDKGVFDRIGYALSKPQGKLVAVAEAVLAAGGLRREFLKDQERERRQVSDKHKAAIRDAGREITKAWQYDRDQLKAMHREQDSARLNDYKGRSADLWGIDKDEAAKSAFDEHGDRRRDENKSRRDSLEAFFGGDKAAIEKARAEQEEQDKRSKERKRNRPRDRDRGGRTMD